MSLSFLAGLGYELDDGEREQVTDSETTPGSCWPPEWAGDRHRRVGRRSSTPTHAKRRWPRKGQPRLPRRHLVAPQPDIFRPGPVNRAPVGGDDPSQAGLEGLASRLDGVVAPGEVVDLRTEDSTTVVTEDGKYETTFFDAPVNFADASGKLVPIDSTLVPAGRPGVALRNAAGPVALSLPSAVGDSPVKASKGDTSVSFNLSGAKGAPAAGVSKKLPAKAAEKVNDKVAKASATYADALPGVDISYTATPEGVKEDIVLSGPTSPTTFDFSVEASKGLTAVETPAGGIDFVDKAGEAKASFAPPFAYDATFETSGAESSFTEDAVSLRIVETSPALVVRLEAEAAWLSDPERARPVVIDPVLTIDGADADTYLSKANPNLVYGTHTIMQLTGGASPRRALHARSIQNFFDEPAALYSATLQLYATNDSSLYTPRPVAVHRINTPGWHSGQATWNSRLTGVAWNTPGGDFDAEPTTETTSSSIANPAATPASTSTSLWGCTRWAPAITSPSWGAGHNRTPRGWRPTATCTWAEPGQLRGPERAVLV